MKVKIIWKECEEYMKILVVGSGGREHAIVWKLKQSAQVEHIYCAPGNPGIGKIAENVNIAVDDLNGLATFAENNKVDLTIVGPEVPLCNGIKDVFNARKLTLFGPDKRGAALEGSKKVAKDFMDKYNIPTAKWASFTEEAPAKSYVVDAFSSGQKGIVVKADGLAAGKGVVVALSVTDAIEAVESCFQGTFGEAGKLVVIEECLFGFETSVIALVDGNRIVPLASAQDHKRLLDGDQGPNTGGMGTCSPAPGYTQAMADAIQQEVLVPVLNGLRAENYDYKGVIFIGFMMTESGPRVLEFNVRFGDPEAQVILSRLQGDFAEICMLTAQGRLNEAQLSWDKTPAVCVIMASGGYPEKYQKGHVITGIEDAEAHGIAVFHAGTSFNEKGEIVNSGGRVLGVTARGNTMIEAIHNAYAGVEYIHWDNVVFRHDIGKKALQ